MIMSRTCLALLAAGALLPPSAAQSYPVEKIAAGVTVVRGPVNGVLIQRFYDHVGIDPIRIIGATWCGPAGSLWKVAPKRLRQRRRRRCSPRLVRFGRAIEPRVSTITPTNLVAFSPSRSR